MNNEDSMKEVLEQVKDLVYFDDLEAAKALCKKHNITEKVLRDIRAKIENINAYEQHFKDFYNV